VGLVENDEIQVGAVLEEELEVLVAGQLVEAGEEKVGVSEGVPEALLSIRSRMRIAKSRWNFSASSACQLSTRLRGVTTRRRRRSPG